MSTHKTRGAIGLLAVVTAVAAVAFGTAGGAGAEPTSPFQLPRQDTLYVSGSGLGPVHELQPDPARTTRRA